MNFSIVIPTYNRARMLYDTLQLLSCVHYRKNKYEIVIVDNNSSDNTHKVTHEFKYNHPELSIRYVFEKKQGRSFACNTGCRVAQYYHIIFLDDDVRVNKNILIIYRNIYKSYSQASVIGGKILAKLNIPIISRKNSFLLDLPSSYRWIFGEYDIGNKRKILKYPQVLFSANISVNLHKLNNPKVVFNENLGRKFNNGYLYAEDCELCLRLLLEKHQIIYEPLLVVKNIIDIDRLNFRYLIRRHVFAGVEKFVIDQQLKDYPKHVPYSIAIDIRTIVSSFKHIRFMRRIFWIDQICEACFIFGYFVLSRIFFKRTFYSKIL